jgi:hypothetical protein
MFPLPYHRNAFYATQAGLVVQNSLSPAAWWKWLDAIFQAQDQFGTPETVGQTGQQVINNLQTIAVSLGVSSDDFSNGMQYGSDFDAVLSQLIN